MALDLPEGQRDSYPAKSAGYCLRASSERSERAAIKNNRMQIHIYRSGLCTPTKLVKKYKKENSAPRYLEAEFLFRNGLCGAKAWRYFPKIASGRLVSPVALG
jgi:hypothetical protein